jgi:hypothetical protein
MHAINKRLPILISNYSINNYDSNKNFFIRHLRERIKRGNQK